MSTTDSATVPCPKCGEDLQISFWTERHRVHNGIGMQTAAIDHHCEITGGDCTCELSEEEMDEAIERAEEQIVEKNDPMNRNPPEDKLRRW